MKTALKATTE